MENALDPAPLNSIPLILKALIPELEVLNVFVTLFLGLTVPKSTKLFVAKTVLASFTVIIGGASAEITTGSEVAVQPKKSTTLTEYEPTTEGKNFLCVAVGISTPSLIH